MTDKKPSELELLRRRAYGPRPDIHLDPQAVSRLRELESRSRPVPIPRSDPDAIEPEPEPSPAVGGNAAERPDTTDDAQRKSVDWSWARELFSRLLRMRRSTALIVVAAVVIVVLALTALTLVQRVQVDPLQTGAEQIARLSVDPSYKVPEFFGQSSGEGGVEAFQDFHGLRTLAAVETNNWFVSNGTEDCLAVFSEEDIKPESASFSGLLLTGCSAGSFPAIAQFEITAQTFPEELRAAFPDSAAFQFVLDADNREIVVFMSR